MYSIIMRKLPTGIIDPRYWTKKKYQETHRNKFKEYRARYYSKHREEMIQRSMKCRKKRWGYYLKYTREYRRNRLRTDPVFREQQRKEGREKYYRNKDKYLERNKKVMQTPEGKARMFIYHAIRCGYIKRPDKCSKCKQSCKPQAHHHSGYKNPLKVQWLCSFCHGKKHQID